jgi:hypothetical protein
VFVSESSRLREIVALYLITTTKDDIMLISQNSSSIFKFVRRVMAKRDSSYGLAARCQTFEIIGIGRVGLAQMTVTELHRTKEIQILARRPQRPQFSPTKISFSFGPCVRAADQKQASERGARLSPNTYARQRVVKSMHPRFLVASRSVHSDLTNKAKIKKGGWARDTEIQPSPRV